MNILQIAWKSIRKNPSSSILGVLLTAFGTGILCVLLLTAQQIDEQLTNNGQGIDLVVGAKGSPIQLILSSIYHIDNPTGNISYDEARAIARHQLVKLAVPLSLGDNYQGNRIVGTDSTFLQLYNLSFAEGRLWQADFEAVIGAEVARKHRLNVGDSLYSAHGLTAEGHVHGDQAYRITGILESSRQVVDRLILTNLSSVWRTHDDGHGQQTATERHTDSHHPGDSSHNDEREPRLVRHPLVDMVNSGREITSLLIQYRNPSAIALFPRMVNQSTALQAASPAFESARLFSLLGIGIDSLEILAYVIMAMAAFSVFISLYSALKRRKYDLAIMRTLGASQGKLFGLVILEGILLTFVGALVGILMGHSAFYLISLRTGDTASLLNAATLLPQEGWLLLTGILIGFFAAVIPAVKAYKTPISQTLSGN